MEQCVNYRLMSLLPNYEPLKCNQSEITYHNQLILGLNNFDEIP